ncbi:hypothetical protein OX89_08975 [Diaphorobacter sp. J5-51]|nr:hypothetical protein OX89_08975 [Diaphorobacter sp. J5-51]
MATENEIRAVLAPRLEAAKSRKEKTRVAATVLFFEYGIYPSAKVVHQYTQQGSMTDIGADLRAFWLELREKSRVQIDAPYLPAELNESFSGALAKLWDLSMDKATASFDAERQDHQEKVRQAEQGLRLAQETNATLEDDVEELGAELRQERENRSAAEGQCAALLAQADELRAALAKAEGQIQASERARQAAQEQFSKDLEAERAARKRDAEMLNGEIRFAKMQIDAARTAEQDARERFKSDLAGKDIELASYRQRLSQAEELAARLRQETAELMVAKATMQRRIDALAQANVKDSPNRNAPKRRVRGAILVQRRKL